MSDLVGSTLGTLMERAENMPNEWDGNELRRYIADMFEGQNAVLGRGVVRQNNATRRLRDYRREVLRRGL